jgi:hypothetical protein
LLAPSCKFQAFIFSSSCHHGVRDSAQSFAQFSLLLLVTAFINVLGVVGFVTLLATIILLCKLALSHVLPFPLMLLQ